MRLPEPAASLWQHHRQTLHERAQQETPPTRLFLGGGTILAARLEHRRSSDIDVFLPDIETIENWKPGGPLDLVRATGGKLEGLRRNRIIVRVTLKSSFDVATVRPKLPGTEIEEEIDGRSETTLTNAQIILGKLYRTEQSVTRDAFDIISVAKGDPTALEIAVNALDTDEIQVVRKNLFGSNDRMAKEASSVLEGITPEYETDLRNLGRNASIATNTHRYQHVLMYVENSRLTVKKQTRARRPPDGIHDADAVREALQRTGIDQYLAANAGVSRQLALDELEKITASAWTGVVFDSSDVNPHERMAAALKSSHDRQRADDEPGDDGPGGGSTGGRLIGRNNPAPNDRVVRGRGQPVGGTRPTTNRGGPRKGRL